MRPSGRLFVEYRYNQCPDTLVPLRGADRLGPRFSRLPRAPGGHQDLRKPGYRIEEPISHADTDGRVHGDQPMDHRTANSAVRALAGHSDFP